MLIFGLSPHGITDPAQVNSFYRDLVGRLRALPGVSNAAILEIRPEADGVTITIRRSTA